MIPDVTFTLIELQIAAVVAAIGGCMLGVVIGFALSRAMGEGQERRPIDMTEKLVEGQFSGRRQARMPHLPRARG